MLIALIVMLIACGIVIALDLDPDDFFFLFLAAFVGVVTTTVGFFITISMSDNPGTTISKLAALQDGSGVEGSFFFSTNTRPVYIAMKLRQAVRAYAARYAAQNPEY